MTSFVHVDHPSQHAGVVRAERAVQWFAGRGNLVIHFLALAGAPALAAAAAIGRWREARRVAQQDAAYWNAALCDARVMADISRAMDVHAKDVSAFWPDRA